MVYSNREKCFDLEIICSEKTPEGYCLVGGPKKCGAYQARIIEVKSDIFCN